MKTVLFTLAAALAALTLAAPAAAQTDDPVAACRAAHASDQQARIACLETAIARMQGRVAEAQQQATQAQQQAAVAEERVAAAESGRPTWSIPGFRARERAAEPEAVTVQLVRIRYGRDGHGFFTTSEGQVWRETVAAPTRRRLDPERTYEAVIDRGFMGGFRMNIEGITWEYKVEPLN